MQTQNKTKSPKLTDIFLEIIKLLMKKEHKLLKEENLQVSVQINIILLLVMSQSNS